MRKQLRRIMGMFLALSIVIGMVLSYDVFADDLVSGTCGDDIAWTINKTTGVLTLSGTGETYDYFDASNPFYSYKDSITSIIVEPGITGLSGKVFSYLDTIIRVSLPDTLKTIGKQVFVNCTSLTDITIPASVTDIDEGAFSYCLSLEKLAIPEGVKEIKVLTFAYCHALKDISIPSSVESIGYESFYSCWSLNNLEIPDSVKTIGEAAFASCRSLESVLLPKDLKSIGDLTFWGCEKLKSVSFRNSVESIGQGVFKFSSNLTDIYFGGSEEDWNKIDKKAEADDPIYSATIHYIPEEVTRLYGKGRYETAFLMADQLKKELGVDKFSSVIIASGAKFPDALGGGYLASIKKAPILLTGTTDKRINAVIDYVKANVASGGTVYLLGGKDAVSTAFESGLTGFKVKRLAGDDRYGTNIAILKEAGISAGEDIIVATGKDYPDSLSASSTGKPMLLVKSKLTSAQIAFLKALKNVSFTIIGGTTAVTEDLEKALSAYGKMNSRLAGSGRYATSVLVAKKYFKDPENVTFVYSHNFPDGLSAGPYAALKKSPIVLTKSSAIAKGATAYLKTLSYVRKGYVIGGPVYDQIDDPSVVTLFDLMNEDYIDTVYRAK